MKLLTFILITALTTMLFSNSFGQKKNKSENETIVEQYAKEANRLDLQTNPDSINIAYDLHGKVLMLDKRYIPSYRSKISIAYKRSNIKEALNTATSFVTEMPYWGDAWVYLGVVQMKLADTTAAMDCFKKAISIYGDDLSKIKSKSWKDQLQFQMNIVQNFMRNDQAVFSHSKTDKNGNERSITMHIQDAETVDRFVNKFMTFNGLQFF